MEMKWEKLKHKYSYNAKHKKIKKLFEIRKTRKERNNDN